MRTESDSFSAKRHYAKWTVAALVLSVIMHVIAASREIWMDVPGIQWLFAPLRAQQNAVIGLWGVAAFVAIWLVTVALMGLIAGWLTLTLKRATEPRG